MLLSHKQIRLCFVCMGNICRSPLAANVFRHKARERGVEQWFVIDSAGTGDWHAGEPPDERVSRVAAAHGVHMTGQARQIKHEDFARFDLLLCMDEDNLQSLLEMGAPAEKVRLLLACDPSADCREVPDPYYGGAEGFENVFTMVNSACEALLDDLLAARK